MPIANMTSGDVPYNLINITGGGNLLDFVRNVNDLTGQFFMLGMLLAGFIILLVSMMNNPNSTNQDALVISGFMISVLAIFFFALEFIKVSMLTIIILAFGAMFMYTVIKKT